MRSRPILVVAGFKPVFGLDPLPNFEIAYSVIRQHSIVAQTLVSAASRLISTLLQAHGTLTISPRQATRARTANLFDAVADDRHWLKDGRAGSLAGICRIDNPHHGA